MTVQVPGVGDQTTAAWGQSVANQVSSAAVAVLAFTPGGNTDTPGAGTATWVTLGNIGVPTWATACTVTYSMIGIFDTGTTSNVATVMKIGTVAGAISHRLYGPGVANQRFYVPIVDYFSSISTGTQSVTLTATFTAGSVIRADTASVFAANFFFLP